MTSSLSVALRTKPSSSLNLDVTIRIVELTHQLTVGLTSLQI